ncbi:hypothetical protein CJF31_00006707 [Rutstroemia sp. NJR-2017a BVV2]|nr:hypothetical protein CJF31_00006707 [Rutstroemia sp. NJR-2017a BVV2]
MLPPIESSSGSICSDTPPEPVCSAEILESISRRTTPDTCVLGTQVKAVTTEKSKTQGHRDVKDAPVENKPVKLTNSCGYNADTTKHGRGSDNDLEDRLGCANLRISVTYKAVADYQYPEFRSEARNFVIGGFPSPTPEHIPMPASNPNTPINPLRCFPPPPNSAYNALGKKTEEEYDPQYLDAFDCALDGARLARDHRKAKPRRRENGDTSKKSTHMPAPPKHADGHEFQGELFAHAIDFDRKSWEDHIPGSSGPFYPAREQRADFIKALDQGVPIEYCQVCKQIHIPPGSPITLPDRDTCGAHLPGWFPSEGMSRPWIYLSEMLNQFVRLSEIEQGYTHLPNPDKPIWNFEFHNDNEKWKEIGRYNGKGGWWKCRSGANATAAEKSCKVCHTDEAIARDSEIRARRGDMTVAGRKAHIENWINNLVAEAGKHEKQIACAMIRAKGIPQHFGKLDWRSGREVQGATFFQRPHLSPEQMFGEQIFMPRLSTDSADASHKPTDSHTSSNGSESSSCDSISTYNTNRQSA